MKRLAIRAFHDARPGTTVEATAALFSASKSLVVSARRKPVASWAALLARTPPSPTRPRPAPRRAPSPSSRPGSRARAVLDEPESFIDVPEACEFDTALPAGVDIDVPGDIDIPDVVARHEPRAGPGQRHGYRDE